MTLTETLASKPLSKNRIGAWCCICDGPSDSELIVDIIRTRKKCEVHVLVKCHGQEELGIFPMESIEFEPEDLMRAMQRRTWFDPADGLGNIPNEGKIK